MTQFEYNPKELTVEQLDAIGAAKASYETTMKRLIEEEDGRIQRYYDCQDDYSWGGICTKVNMMERDRAWRLLQERIEEIVRGGFIIRSRRVNILRDLSTGDLVATGTHEGQYGRYFRTDDGRFVSCTKKVSTYQKKGFNPLIQTITEKLVGDGYWRDGERRYKVIETLSITEEVSTEICY